MSEPICLFLWETCPSCEGYGETEYVSGEIRPCWECDGAGGWEEDDYDWERYGAGGA